MKSFVYRTIIEPDEKGYHGFVPLLRGVHTVGKTIEETKKNLDGAIRCHLEGLLKDNIEPPREQNTVEAIQTFTQMVEEQPSPITQLKKLGVAR